MKDRQPDLTTCQDTRHTVKSSPSFRPPALARRGMTNFIGQKQWLRALSACVCYACACASGGGSSRHGKFVHYQHHFPKTNKMCATVAPPGFSPIQKNDESNRVANLEFAFGQWQHIRPARVARAPSRRQVLLGTVL